MANIVYVSTNKEEEAHASKCIWPPETLGFTRGIPGISVNAGQAEQVLRPLLKAPLSRRRGTRSARKLSPWTAVALELWKGLPALVTGRKKFQHFSSERSWCRDVHRYWTTCS